MSVIMCEGELEFAISGYEKEKRDSEDDWVNVGWQVHNETINFKNFGYYMECCEVEELRDMIKDFLNGDIKEMKSFVPLEPAFQVRFYPVVDDYSKQFGFEKPTMEIIVYPEAKSDGAIDLVGAFFTIHRDEASMMYDYLIKMTE